MHIFVAKLTHRSEPRPAPHSLLRDHTQVRQSIYEVLHR